MTVLTDVHPLLLYIVSAGPWLLILLLGAGLCLRHAGDQRRRAVLVGLALLIELVSWGFNFFAVHWVYVYIDSAAQSDDLAQIVLGLCSSLPSAVAWALLLYAVFYGNSRRVEQCNDELSAP